MTSMCKAGMVAIFLAAFSTTGWAQGEAGDEQSGLQPVHWAFASLVGTGWYDVAGGRSAFILGAAPRQSLRAAEYRGEGERRIGINIRYDATLGLYRLEDFLDLTDADNVSTLSFTPGMELEIPLNERWDLRVFANLGWGTALGEDVSAWIYYTGVKSQYRFDVPLGGLSLLNGVWYAGYSSDDGPSEELAALFAGAEYRHGVARPRWREEPLDLIWHLGYTYMAVPAEFGLRGLEATSIGDTVELGLAVALRERPFRVFGVEFDRFGLTYALGDNGEFGSITLNLESWFTR